MDGEVEFHSASSSVWDDSQAQALRWFPVVSRLAQVVALADDETSSIGCSCSPFADADALQRRRWKQGEAANSNARKSMSSAR
jgi:hypothetical protein